jgi:hypothetical protein
MKTITTTAVLETVLAKYNIETSFYFDRLSIYFDASSKKERLGKLLDDNDKNKFIWNSLPHNDFFDRKIELFQPSLRCLNDLVDPKIVGGDCAITYAEFAMDFITDDSRDLKNLVRFFNSHLVRIPNKARPYHHDYEEKTAYFSPQKNKERLLFYHDKLARTVDGKLCLHIEYRMKGLSLLKGKDIYTIRDLMDFNHHQLWKQLLDFRKVNLTELGRVCVEGDTSRQADHKRGKKEWLTIKSLQQYLGCHPEREPAFTKITPANLGQHLGEFLNIKID